MLPVYFIINYRLYIFSSSNSGEGLSILLEYSMKINILDNSDIYIAVILTMKLFITYYNEGCQTQRYLYAENDHWSVAT